MLLDILQLTRKNILTASWYVLNSRVHFCTACPPSQNQESLIDRLTFLSISVLLHNKLRLKRLLCKKPGLALQEIG